MTSGADDRALVSRWREIWAFLRRIEAAAVTGDDLRDERLDRHDRRLAALEEEIGALRRADATAKGGTPAGPGVP